MEMQKTGKKWVYSFSEGDVTMKQLLGGKGANLCDMTKIGLPVPFGFTITTEVCDYYNKNNKQYPAEMQKQIDSAIIALENKEGMKFGDPKNPLLVSVRSGAAVSMPGMMDTILNLGLNDQTLAGLIASTKNERFCLDSYRRFIQMFGDVVMEVEHAGFEEILENRKQTRGIRVDTDLNIEDLKWIITAYRKMIMKAKGTDFPQDVKTQLRMAIDAVFGSWNNPRALTYRRLNDIKGLLGTAVNVQAMVFGNMGDDCGTGVAFTRNPSTGENKFYGEYLINAQGEDVVAGIRTPQPVVNMQKDMPLIYNQLLEIREKLEKHYKDMQDIEFTIQKGKLYMLQTRNGKRTGHAAVKIAVDLVKEKLLTEEQGLLKVDPVQLDQLLHKRLDPIAKQKLAAIARGLPASPGAAVGKIVFNAEDAAILSKEKAEKIILVRIETSPEDIEGMHVSQGILTARGGMTSHAAVVARGMGKCCVAGCGELQIDEHKKTLKIKDQVFKEGDYLTLDGSTGEVYAGQLPVIDPILAGEFAVLMSWAKKYKRLGVRTNADTPHDAQIAKDFGAEGIGLTRTEHMFFEGERIMAMREMILADNEEGRRKALNKLLPYQVADFEGIFKVMNNLPVIIRFLDPPLHEFLPKEDKEIQELGAAIKMPVEKIKQRISELHEFNPMLGFRGVRLGIVYPEISEMQARAIFQAAINVSKQGISTIPEIEIPNVISVVEFKVIKDIIKKVAKETGAEGKINYKVGTMIEFPRAAMVADELATEAEFMSFGTNDLTQTTLGFSRDDAGRFIPNYLSKNIFEKDPFQTIDQEGVGRVMKIAINKARSVKHDMDMGICGEHGGDPASVKFCHKIGLSNVSCSPYRVPIAILAAAQAAIESRLLAQKNQVQNKAQVQNQNKPQVKVPIQKPIQQNNHQQKVQIKPMQQNNQQRPQNNNPQKIQIKPQVQNNQKNMMAVNIIKKPNQSKIVVVNAKQVPNLKLAQIPKQNIAQKQLQPKINIPAQKQIQKIAWQQKAPVQQNNQKQQVKVIIQKPQNNNQQKQQVQLKPVQQNNQQKPVNNFNKPKVVLSVQNKPQNTQINNNQQKPQISKTQQLIHNKITETLNQLFNKNKPQNNKPVQQNNNPQKQQVQLKPVQQNNKPVQPNNNQQKQQVKVQIQKIQIKPQVPNNRPVQQNNNQPKPVNNFNKPQVVIHVQNKPVQNNNQNKPKLIIAVNGKVQQQNNKPTVNINPQKQNMQGQLISKTQELINNKTTNVNNQPKIQIKSVQQNNNQQKQQIKVQIKPGQQNNQQKPQNNNQQKQGQQKLNINPQINQNKAVSIRDEIRNIIRQEIKNAKK